MDSGAKEPIDHEWANSARAALRACRAYPIPYPLKEQIRVLLGEPPQARKVTAPRRNEGPTLLQ